jgi:ankyrin repeat protein
MASSREDLFAAIDAGDAEAVGAIVGSDPSAASARDAEGVSALMRARYRSDRAVMEAVRAAACDLDVVEAAAYGDLDRLRALLREAELARAVSADGFTPLHVAAFFGRADAAELLLATGADPNARGTGWMTGTPLHSAASARHAEIVRMLVGAGADPNATQSGGWTPLHSAAHNGDVQTVQLLLAAGADPTAINDDGRSVLSLAEERGDAETVAGLRSALQG